MPEHLFFRQGTESDLPQITEIYNHYVVHTAITFDIEPFSVEDRKRKWFVNYDSDGPYRLLVAILGDKLVGYATSSRFKEKAAYASSVETSIYLRPDQKRQGIGIQLYSRLLNLLRSCEVHRAYGGITLPNEASINLHLKLGFKSVGTHNEVGYKFGRYHSVQWFEKAIR